MKVVLTNTTMANGGDAAIALSILEILRLAFGDELGVTLVDSMSEVVAAYYPKLRVRQSLGFPLKRSKKNPLDRLSRRLRKQRLRLAIWLMRHSPNLAESLLSVEERATLNCYRVADLIISSGGTYLVDHYDLTPRLIEFEAISALGCPLLLYTQSLGPFDRPGLKEALKPYFDRSRLILLRDDRSRQVLEGMGVEPRKLHVLADCVFGLAQPEILRNAAQRQSDVRRVAISVRNWSYFRGQRSDIGMKRYLSGVAAAATWLARELNCEIEFLSTCQGIPEYHADDSLVAEQVVALMPNDLVQSRVRVDRDFHDPNQLHEMIRKFDLVIATRMHMAIMALSAGIPVLPIAYEFKTMELFVRLGLGDWVTPIEDVDEAQLPKMVERFIGSLPRIRRLAFEAVERERASALRATELISTVWTGASQTSPAVPFNQPAQLGELETG